MTEDQKKYLAKAMGNAFKSYPDGVDGGIEFYIDQENKVKFSTYEAAIEEIRRLQIENNALKYEPPKGRPKGLKSSGFSLFGLGGSAKIKSKGGAPQQNSLKEMAEFVTYFEGEKAAIGIKFKRLFKNDRQFLTFIAARYTETASLRSDKKKAWIDKSCNRIKYFRDETGIRQKKRKTSSKNA